MPLSVGDRVGRFKLVGLLGEGGMGAVYRAEDSVLGRAVALKILHAGDASAAKLLHEARAAAALNHPNAVAVFDVGEADGVAYIAMELLSGDTLRAHMGVAGVPLGKRLAWLLDVASALEAAHKRGIVHRDIKPENVFVRSDGVIKVLDFGIARRVSAPVDATGATLGGELATSVTATAADTGGIAGTPVYMAPEQLKGEPIDGKTDQFGWGVVAYELLTGDVPWNTSLGGLQLVSQILSRTPEAPSAKRAEIPKGVDRVVLRALAKKRADRFEDMGALIDALSEAIGGEPAGAEEAPAEPPKAAATEKAEASEDRAKSPRVAMVALLGVALIVGGVLFARRVQRPGAQVASVAGSASAGSAVGPPDHGSKMSTNAAALTEYRAGMQAMVDAADSTATDHFTRAAEIDPGFAAAHLRRALMVSQSENPDAPEHFEKALSLRAELGAHDRALLDALAAALKKPAETAEVERTFGALEELPDADARYIACRLRFFLLGQDEAAIRVCRRAWQIDGAHAGAHLMEGRALMHAENVEAARGAFAECVRISPSAANCLLGLFNLDTYDGKCAEAAALARKLIAVEPNNAAWRADLVYTLVDIGAPPESYEEALKQYLARLDESDRAIGEAQTRFVLAVLRGDFDEAAARTEAWERAVAPENDELSDHWNVFFEKWSLEIETGHVQAAGALAERYRKQRAAWNTSDDEVGGYLLALRYASGRLTRSVFEKQRDDWLAKRSQPLALDDWIPTFGYAIVTSNDARAAVAALESMGGVPSSGLPGALYYTIGDAYLRAGEPRKAITFLRRATTSCMAMAGPFEQTHAFADLATALGETGDPAGACEALRALSSRWGKAPASVTAAAGRRLWAKLGCSP